MTAQHLELLVEEPSMEALLRALLPRLLPTGRTFEVHAFQGKDDLLGKLRARLRAMRSGCPRTGASSWWYFGDWVAVRSAYARVSPAIPNKREFCDPDAIVGGTWEAFERILQRHGYFETGLRKLEVARIMGVHVAPRRSRSRSFVKFHEALTEATA